MLVVLLAGVLCCLYVSDTLLLAFNYRFYAANPPSAQLLLLTEASKFVLSACLEAWGQRGTTASRHAPEAAAGKPGAKQRDLPTARSVAEAATHAQPGASSLARAWAAIPASARAMLTFSVPALCYCGSAK